jgi:hypothetical protein
MGTLTLIRTNAHTVIVELRSLSAALGLLALLIAFSFSMALSRYERRRDMVLEEANAIGSTANFTLMLPPSAQRPILSLLREYTAVRVALGVPYDSQKMKKDIARSLDIQARLWQQAAAVATAEPQSLPAYLFVSSLNEINNIHEKRLTALRNHVPVVVVLMQPFQGASEARIVLDNSDGGFAYGHV